MNRAASKLSLQEFLASPEINEGFEFVDGEVIPKVSPKYKHSSLQLRLLLILNQWCESFGRGRVLPEWAVILQRRGRDWVPVPDLTYVSYERLSADWDKDEPCPVIPELVIEIISPGQSFGEMTQKATDYLIAGVSRVWVADNQAQSIASFGANELPQTFWINDTISDELLPGLIIPIADLFVQDRRQDSDINPS